MTLLKSSQSTKLVMTLAQIFFEGLYKLTLTVSLTLLRSISLSLSVLSSCSCVVQTHSNLQNNSVGFPLLINKGVCKKSGLASELITRVVGELE